MEKTDTQSLLERLGTAPCQSLPYVGPTADLLQDDHSTKKYIHKYAKLVKARKNSQEFTRQFFEYAFGQPDYASAPPKDLDYRSLNPAVAPVILNLCLDSSDPTWFPAKVIESLLKSRQLGGCNLTPLVEHCISASDTKMLQLIVENAVVIDEQDLVKMALFASNSEPSLIPSIVSHPYCNRRLLAKHLNRTSTIGQTKCLLEILGGLVDEGAQTLDWIAAVIDGNQTAFSLHRTHFLAHLKQLHQQIDLSLALTRESILLQSVIDRLSPASATTAARSNPSAKYFIENVTL